MDFVQKLLAEAIERVFKNRVTSIIGVLVIAAGAITGASNAISDTLMFHGVHVKSALVVIGSVITGVALLLAKDAGIKINDISGGTGKLGAILAIAALLALAPAGRAQSNPAPDPIQNIYGLGVTFNQGGSPQIAGTGIYAHLVAGSGTYAFGVLDGVPTSTKPLTVTSNVGIGIAQKVATIAKVPIYVPTAAGISWSGSSTGFQWSGGGLAAIHVRGSLFLMPTVRFNRSSIDGTYHPLIGILIGAGN